MCFHFAVHWQVVNGCFAPRSKISGFVGLKSFIAENPMIYMKSFSFPRSSIYEKWEIHILPYEIPWKKMCMVRLFGEILLKWLAYFVSDMLHWPPNSSMEHLGFAGHACQLHRTPHEQMLGRVDPIWLYRAEGSATSPPRQGSDEAVTQMFCQWGNNGLMICKCLGKL